jgi:hypothetical protein
LLDITSLSKLSADMLSDEKATPEQLAVLRRMTPEQRWRAANDLYWTVRQHKTAFLQQQHPEWTGEQVEDEVRRIFLYARS